MPRLDTFFLDYHFSPDKFFVSTFSFCVPRNVFTTTSTCTCFTVVPNTPPSPNQHPVFSQAGWDVGSVSHSCALLLCVFADRVSMCAEDSVARCWQSPKANFNLTLSNCASSNKTVSLLLLSRRKYENRCCCLPLSSSFSSLYPLSLFLFLNLSSSSIQSRGGRQVACRPVIHSHHHSHSGSSVDACVNVRNASR